MSSYATHSDPIRERRAKYFWVTFILGFFVLDISIAVIAIVMAASDPSFRPMPGYGERAVEWDIHQHERLRSHALGWKVAIRAEEPARSSMQITIHDRDDQPITGATGSLSVYHFTRVAERQVVDVEEVEPGQYRAAIDCRRPGLWHVELRLRRTNVDNERGLRNDDLFVHEASLAIAMETLQHD